MEDKNLPKTVEKSKAEQTKKTGLIIRNLKTVSWWWVTKIALAGVIVCLLMSPYGLYKLGLKVIKETGNGKCCERKSLLEELKLISELGIKGYLRYNWVEIKDFLLALLS